MKINQERLWTRLHELSQFGKQEKGGVTRFSFTEEERKAKDLVISYMKEAGMMVQEDAAGNVIGRKKGKNEASPAVLIGSHIDSVPKGGIFDGPLGVIAGIEVVQTMNESDVETEHPVEVIAFTDEEGSRFGFGMIGSRALAGTLQSEHLQQSDQDGMTIAQAMAKAGLNPECIAEAARNPETVKAYVELHIEQGKVLEYAGHPAGIVTGIAGPLWTRWTIKGEAGHAGATPMNQRKDALMAALNVIQYIEEETKKYPNAVATVGQIDVKPGGVNVIPGETTFTLDLRDIDESVRDEVEAKIISYAQAFCEGQGMEIEVDTLQRVAPAPCSDEIRAVMEEACRAMGIDLYSLPSGAGHDGMQFNEFCPIGMIFVRSKNGISHNPNEWSSKEDCGIGTSILYNTVLHLAK
ncbi:hydantoinase/carbamoylase family amidase [Bacillus aerolatus]|uniref:Hydantoinase/carbamoylase family amidase n=1 Tax=Bacillus aerolatus TaxID=2653354 RepID=A0A6I1FM97_9BACI|nr:Zn-dependent hydrolase [Bacillus aerolatus]KAB7708149.1 hydantoinase/carbamoylase family amidase [Bacillus aerolatus]